MSLVQWSKITKTTQNLPANFTNNLTSSFLTFSRAFNHIYKITKKYVTKNSFVVHLRTSVVTIQAFSDAFNSKTKQKSKLKVNLRAFLVIL